jgi:hypothetical protein
MKLKNVPRLTATCALPRAALVEKSTAARERYIQPRLGQQGSKLAVKQIYACAALEVLLCAVHELKRPTGNAEQRKRRKGSSRSAVEVCGDARGNNGPINQRRLEAQKGLEYVLRIGRLARLDPSSEQVLKKRHDRHHEALRMQLAHLLNVANARDGLG